MIVLDENIDVFQRQQLERWRLRFRRIGGEVGRFGMKDCNEVIPLLHALRRPTFFTRDRDFYQPRLCHPGYCLVFLEVAPSQAAHYLRRFLRHPSFRTQAQRMGKVVSVHKDGIAYWQVGVDEAQIRDRDAGRVFGALGAVKANLPAHPSDGNTNAARVTAVLSVNNVEWRPRWFSRSLASLSNIATKENDDRDE